MLQLKFCFGQGHNSVLSTRMKRSQLIGYFTAHYNKRLCIHKNTLAKAHNPARSQSKWMFLLDSFCLISKCPSITKRTLLDTTTLSFIYQTMCERAYVWNNNSFFFASCPCLCSLFVNKHLGPALINMQSLILTDDEMESQPNVLYVMSYRKLSKLSLLGETLNHSI